MPDAVLLQHIFYPRAQHCCIVVATGTNIQQNQFEYIENSGNLNLPIHNHCHCHYRQKRKKNVAASGKQLLLNYFSHPKSSLLLFPYAPVVNFINHVDSTASNV